MSIYNTICCSRCGRDLYRPLTVPEYRERQVLHFPGLYVVNDNGQEELCEKCFEVWQKTEMYQEKMRELNKRKKELENQLNISVQNNIENEMSMCCCTTTEDSDLIKDLENALFVYDDTDCIKVKYIRQLLDKYKNRK